MIDFGALRAFQAQFDGQLIARGVAQILTIKKTLQARVMAAVFTLDHAFGGVDRVVVNAGLGQQSQQQIEHLALVLRRGFDDEGGVGIAGEGVPFAAQGLHAFFETTFASGVNAAEQQMFEQVWQLFFVAVKIVETDADHQTDRHVPTLGAGLEHQLQTVWQRITFDLKTIQGEGG